MRPHENLDVWKMAVDFVVLSIRQPKNSLAKKSSA
jgi:hypothetical protein